jgi:hypothetical protein
MDNGSQGNRPGAGQGPRKNTAPRAAPKKVSLPKIHPGRQRDRYVVSRLIFLIAGRRILGENRLCKRWKWPPGMAGPWR